MFRYSSLAILNRGFAVMVLVLLMASSAWSVDYKVLHNFGPGGSRLPSSGLVIDAQGNAYGTTAEGCLEGGGTVYEMSPTTGYHQLYHFSCYGSGGNGPQGNLAIDSAGNLYGTTISGGDAECGHEMMPCGVVFKLSPPSDGVGPWTETVLYTFCSQANCVDGAGPQSGVIFDAAGNLYGTTHVGGKGYYGDGVGTVFELSPTPSGWTETVLYSFCSQANCADGVWPYGGLIFDAAGNVYGTTTEGGNASDGGTVFELSPTGSGWTESVLYNFCSQANCADSGTPFAGVTFDPAGNLYGTTSDSLYQACVPPQCGAVFELTPSVGGGWTETTLHTFGGRDGAVPYAGVVLDSSGNVYGTTLIGGENGCSSEQDGCGTVFKLTPEPGGQWRESVFRFSTETGGAWPKAPVILDSAGNIYGTTTSGGTNNSGVVFKITP